ncbi:hypothetical protein FXN61_41100 [Lentzea sp. PSKA42]|uniref:IPT/TIG domain-containing protein n=1 Tax=Lentzea indica TaxID=2604800 RepID=A0ABX1FUQ8_9PSEU|nr:FGLLP motif-containing membrane protein [Lentzea indica]NKE62783.1 hypothetical protein [Lentzea indica]
MKLVPFIAALLFCATPSAAAAQESVSLVPASGPAGTSITVTGKGYDTCVGAPMVDVSFDRAATGVSAPIRADGSFTAVIKVPGAAVSGDHFVAGACRDSGKSVSARFEVTAVASDPAITLRPASGRAASSVGVRGTGFTACPDRRVDIVWDEKETGVTSAVAADGTFTATFTVPRNASLANHRVMAACPSGDYAHAAFTVNAAALEPTTTTRPTVTTTSKAETTTSPPSQTTTTTSVAAVPPPPRPGWPEPAFVSRMPTASQVLDFAAAALPWGILVVVLIWVLVGWPAELFNSTYKQNEPTIRRWLGRPGIRAPRRPSAWPLVLVFAAIAAGLLTFVQAGPEIGRDDVALALGYLLAIPLVAVGYEFAIETHHRNTPGGGIARLRIVVPALVVAVICALVSRWLDFVPGYVYGLLIAYIEIDGRSRLPRVRAVGVLRGVLLLFALAGGAWVLWQFGTHPATTGDTTSLPLRVLDTALVQIAVLGMETLVIGLIPIDFLHGGVLREWSRKVWFAVYAPAAVLFVLLLIGPQQTLQREGGSRPVDVLKSIWLFLGFCTASFAFWGFFKLVKRRSMA